MLDRLMTRRGANAHPTTPIVLVLCSLLTGCSFLPSSHEDELSHRMPEDPARDIPPPAAVDGAIWSDGASMNLFGDLRASRVGDILTINLVESTNATKSSTTSTSKSTDVSVANPTVFGRPVTRDGIPLFGGSVDSDQSFEGEGGATQSNRLEGSVTVTVIERLPNGNLYVRGEKWLTLNQGKEYVRLSGIVRPVDILSDNSVSSEKVANARIEYAGKGALADANRMNWLARFFNSPWLPF